MTALLAPKPDIEAWHQADFLSLRPKPTRIQSVRPAASTRLRRTLAPVSRLGAGRTGTHLSRQLEDRGGEAGSGTGLELSTHLATVAYAEISDGWRQSEPT